MSNYNGIGEIIDSVLKKALEEEVTIWLVEEETGESIKLYDLLNSVKNSEEVVFKRI
ncbi:hypothetical protein [Clostridium beijerinckii]|uniref:hypothetical protein n=1 Tax=Clostridium beijerinckii TaxID=1520 RepID=UPI0009C55818|nr:hypothetical protein [Clostridium beijerinckii]NRT76335.1 hypothetical protein [Clostridium beijerinckii]OOM48628.1 hypothetical protein CBEIJ_21000 [Clostridium beijerinckii]